jgi:hypothetical protein
MSQISLFQTLADAMLSARPMYFNTLSLTGAELKTRRIKAGGETERILSFFEAHPSEAFTPYEVERRLFPDKRPMHLTNTRRSITTLTKNRLLEKVGRKVEESGEWNFTWKLKTPNQ